MQIKLSFMGAAQNVTGSSYLLEVNGKRILVDCGLYQERDYTHRNWEPFDFDPASLDAVLVTHAHVDHCGRIPKLVKEGYRGRIYCTKATSAIAQIILLDSAHLQMEDAAFKSKRHQREKRKGPYPELPLYTTDDAEASFPLFSPVDYMEQVELGDGISAVFYDAGHVLGSSMIKITIRQDGEARTLVFSGDLGRWDRPIINDPTAFREVDYIVVESTYGDRVHEETPDIADRLAEVVNSTYEAGGNIIVPSFALQRSQEILYHMNNLLIENRIPHILVFLDSPMAARITEVYKQNTELFDTEMSRLIHQHKSPFSFPGFTMTQSTEESKALNHVKGTIMIIAGSGMCTGGRVKHHLVTNITRPESTILFVGYQAIGTLGRRIVDGAGEVRILGQLYPVKARIAKISGFSAHADKNEILRWLSSLTRPPRNLFITHGEAEAAQALGSFLKSETGWPVKIPAFREAVTLE